MATPKQIKYCNDLLSTNSKHLDLCLELMRQTAGAERADLADALIAKIRLAMDGPDISKKIDILKIVGGCHSGDYAELLDKKAVSPLYIQGGNLAKDNCAELIQFARKL